MYRKPPSSKSTAVEKMADAEVAAATALPTMKFLVRGRQGIEVQQLVAGGAGGALAQAQNAAVAKVGAPPQPPVVAEDDIFVGAAFGPATREAVTKFSPDGQLLAVATPMEGIKVYDCDSARVVFDKETETILAIGFSPRNSYMVTWQRPSKGEDAEGNLIIWAVSSGEIAARFYQKNFRKDSWPGVQWNDDETLACRMVNNEVHIYAGQDIAAGITAKLRQQNLLHFSVAPGPGALKIATFVPEIKGKTAGVYIYKYPALEQATNSKHMYKAETVHFKWAPDGSVLLFQTHTDVDKSGKSYYGETALFLLNADGGFDCSVPQAKEGPIFDVQWSPTSKHFAVVAGSMPAKTVLFDAKATPTFEFGMDARNTIIWSPHGRFLCIAGLGNLAGDMDFWDMYKKKKMGTTNSSCAVQCIWSPDSRWFLTATTHPRLRVDNGFKIFRYNGSGPELVQAKEEIYECVMRPFKPGIFPDRPQSPRLKGQKSPVAAAKAAKPKAYRAPGSSGAFAAMLAKERGGPSGGAGKKLSGGGFSSRAGVPGMAPPEEKGPSRNQKRREAKKKAEADAKAAEEAAAKAAEGAKAAKAEDPSLMSADEKKKMLKKLNKKLKAIDDIKKKQADGTELNADQKSKIQSEAELRAQIAKVEAAS